MTNSPVSIIIRAKNEEKWLDSCLFAVSNQDYHNFEIVLVDNESTDHTLEIAERYDCKIVYISDKEFNFSKALNIGIKAARGELIAILSGHCIPADEQWLLRLAMHLKSKDVIATYGRQIPLPDSDAADKRDLWITFGQDRKIQRKDYFFHNANSMIRRETWEKIPFNENIHGVEDQDWAKKVLNQNIEHLEIGINFSIFEKRILQFCLSIFPLFIVNIIFSKKIKQLKEEEEKELIEWETEIQTIKSQIEKVDNDIFSKIE